MPSLARVACSKLCMTPLGVPVEPDVYISMAMSSGLRCGLPAIGSLALTIASQVSNVFFGAKGKAMHGRPAGMPGICCAHVSSLPTNNRLAPLCSSTYFTVSADSVGKMATVVPPDIQIASSAIMKCAVFFDNIAMRTPGSKPRELRCVAMRRAWSIIWRQV